MPERYGKLQRIMWLGAAVFGLMPCMPLLAKAQPAPSATAQAGTPQVQSHL